MKAWLVLLCAVAFGVAPFITDEFAGFRPDQFPIPQDDAPVQPAGYAFSIWGVIYLWLLVYGVLGVWRHRDDPDWEDARLPMIISMGVGAIWIKVATLSVIWATGLIWVMCLSALYALLCARNAGPSWSQALPIGLYAGWLTAASFVALGLTGAGYGIAGPALFWAYMVIGIAIPFAAANQLTFQGVWSYGVAVGWALIGVAAQNWGSETLLSLIAGLGAVVIVALALRQVKTAR